MGGVEILARKELPVHFDNEYASVYETIGDDTRSPDALYSSAADTYNLASDDVNNQYMGALDGGSGAASTYQLAHDDAANTYATAECEGCDKNGQRTDSAPPTNENLYFDPSQNQEDAKEECVYEGIDDVSPLPSNPIGHNDYMSFEEQGNNSPSAINAVYETPFN